MPWAELPATTTALTEMYHCITDVAKTAEGYYPRNYAMGYDKSKKAALWVAYPMHPFYTTGSAGSSSFSSDPSLGRTEQMVSGVDAPYNRGHQIANADRKVSSTANKQTYYFSNMTAQLAKFNSPTWSALEGSVRSNSCADTLYVVTGCHFDGSQTSTTDKGGYELPVPTHYYKVLLRSKSGSTGKAVGSLTAGDLQCIGFWYTHTDSSGQTPAACAKSVDEIERLTGFSFFANVPNAPKSSYALSDWSL